LAAEWSEPSKKRGKKPFNEINLLEKTGFLPSRFGTRKQPLFSCIRGTLSNGKSKKFAVLENN
jgi:hypothetical protein